VSLLYGEEEVADFCLEPCTTSAPSSARTGSLGGFGSADYETQVQ